MENRRKPGFFMILFRALFSLGGKITGSSQYRNKIISVDSIVDRLTDFFIIKWFFFKIHGYISESWILYFCNFDLRICLKLWKYRRINFCKVNLSCLQCDRFCSCIRDYLKCKILDLRSSTIVIFVCFQSDVASCIVVQLSRQKSKLFIMNWYM